TSEMLAQKTPRSALSAARTDDRTTRPFSSRAPSTSRRRATFHPAAKQILQREVPVALDPVESSLAHARPTRRGQDDAHLAALFEDANLRPIQRFDRVHDPFTPKRRDR